MKSLSYTMPLRPPNHHADWYQRLGQCCATSSTHAMQPAA